MILRIRNLNAVLFVVAVVPLIFYSYGTTTAYLAQRAASRTFLPSEATVISSDFDRTISHSSGSRTSSSRYRPVITYRYIVNGTTYVSSRTQFFGNRSYSNYKEAFAILEQYPAGSSITAYYDPANPARAVLSVEEPATIDLLGLVAMLGLALLFLFFGYRSIRKTAFASR